MGIPDIIKLFTREGRKFYFFLAKTAGYWPHDVNVFRTAFVHKSAGKRLDGHDGAYNNERLEYLGDAVIETAVSDILFHKYPDADEGFLSHIRSNMVCRARLNAISFSLGLDKYVVMASRKDMENSHISGDVLEAFVAAIYLDGGMRRAFKFIERAIASQARIDEALHDSVQTNYKSMLVNLGEQNSIEILFDTRRTENARRVDDDAMNFVCEIKVAETPVGQGFGRSKKMAEQRAAESVCKGIESGEIDLLAIKEAAKGEHADCDETVEPSHSTGLKHEPAEPITTRRLATQAGVGLKEILEDFWGSGVPLAERMTEMAARWDADGQGEMRSYDSRFKEYALQQNMAEGRNHQSSDSTPIEAGSPS